MRRAGYSRLHNVLLPACPGDVADLGSEHLSSDVTKAAAPGVTTCFNVGVAGVACSDVDRECPCSGTAESTGSGCGPVVPDRRPRHSPPPSPPPPSRTLIITLSSVPPPPATTSHHTPLQASHTGLQASHTGLQASHTGLQASHTGLQASHAGLQSSHTGLQASHTGLQSSHTGLQSSHTGLQSSHTGLQLPDTGLKSSDIGVQSSDSGVQSSDIGLQSSDIGVQSSGSGVEWSDPGLESSDAVVERVEPSLALCRYQVWECCWYYPGMSCQQAHQALADSPLGTFLLRDSSHPQHMFALSINTSRGVSSVRIHYSPSGFCLDTVTNPAGSGGSGGSSGSGDSGGYCRSGSRFPDVISLVRYYVALSDAQRRGRHHRAATGQWVLTDGSGNMVTIGLSRPLISRRVPSLQHLTRLVMNRNKSILPPYPDQLVADSQKQRLPKLISNYLDLYPHQF